MSCISLVNKVIAFFVFIWTAVGGFLASIHSPLWFFGSSSSTCAPDVDLEIGKVDNEIIGDPFAADGPSWYADDAPPSVDVDLERGRMGNEVVKGSLIARAVRAVRRSFSCICLPSWLSKPSCPANIDLERGEADEKALQESLARALRRIDDINSGILVFGKDEVKPVAPQVDEAVRPVCDKVKVPTRPTRVEDSQADGFVDLGKLKHIYRIKHQGRPNAPRLSIPTSPRRNYKTGHQLSHVRYKSGHGDELFKWVLVGQAIRAEISPPSSPPPSSPSPPVENFSLISSSPSYLLLSSLALSDEDEDGNEDEKEDEDRGDEGVSSISTSSSSSASSLSLYSMETGIGSPPASPLLTDEDCPEEFSVAISAGEASRSIRQIRA